MIAWESEMSKALARATAEHKCVLLEFFSPECIGCKQLDAVTYPDPDVENFVSDRMVPLKVPVSAQELTAQFRVFWTPTLIVLDLYGKEHQRTLGYLPPEEMGAYLLLGIGKAALGSEQYNEAVLQFNTLLNGYPDSAAAPEAVYLRGVARYLVSRSAPSLKECYQQLLSKYPGSEWTRRAEPFSLL